MPLDMSQYEVVDWAKPGQPTETDVPAGEPIDPEAERPEPKEGEQPEPSPYEVVATDPLSRTVEELTADDNFSPQQYFNQHGPKLTDEQVDKLAEVEAAKINKVTPWLEGTGDFVAGAWGMFKTVLSSLLPVAWSATKNAGKFASKDPRVVAEGASEALAAAESATIGNFQLAEWGWTGYQDFQRRHLVRWANRITAPSETARVERMAAEQGADPYALTLEDARTRLIARSLMQEVLDETRRGEGPVSGQVVTALNDLGLDVKVDTHEIENLEWVVDPLNVLPAGVGFRATTKGGKTVMTAATKSALTTGIRAARNKVAGLLTKGADALKKHAPVGGSGVKSLAGGATGAMVGAAIGGPAGAAIGAGIGRGGMTAGTKLTELAMRAGARAAAGKGTLGAAADIVEGAVRGAAAPLTHMSPEAAIYMGSAAGMLLGGDARGAGEVVGNAAGFGTIGGAAAGARNAIGRAHHRAVLNSFRPSTEDLGDVPTTDIGADPMLDDTNWTLTEGLRALRPAAASRFNWLRNAIRERTGTEAYILPREQFGQVVGAIANMTPEQAAGQHGFYDPKTKRIYLNENTVALGHETGHLLMETMDPRARGEFLQSLKDAYTPEQRLNFGKGYDESLGVEADDPHSVQSSDERTLSEIGAELLSLVISSEDLGKVPNRPIRNALDWLTAAGEQLGISKATMLEGAEGESPLGVGPSAAGAAPARRAFRNIMDGDARRAGLDARRGAGLAALGYTPDQIARMTRAEADEALNTNRPGTEPPEPLETRLPPVVGPGEPVVPPTPAAPAAEPPAASAAPEPGTTASVPVMITREMESRLMDRGYTRRDINAMTPQQANEILSRPPIRPGDPAAPGPVPPAPAAEPPRVETPPVIPLPEPTPPPVLPRTPRAPRASAAPPPVPPPTPPTVNDALAPAAPPAVDAALGRQTAPAGPAPRPTAAGSFPSTPAAVQAPGHAEADAAIAADDPRRPAFDQLAAHMGRGQPFTTPVAIAYEGVRVGERPPPKGASEAQVRAAEQDAAYVAESLGAMPADVRSLFDKNTVPYRWTVRGNNVNVLAMSPDKVAANVRRVTERAGVKNRDLIPYNTNADGTLTDDGWRQYASDVVAYTQNQAAGFGGDGTAVVRPPGYVGDIGTPVPGYQPTSIPKARADFVNLTMALPPPQTARAPGGYADKPVSQYPNVQAALLATGNKRSTTPARKAAGQTYSKGGLTAEVTETNPLRDTFSARGIDLTGRELFQVTEELNLEGIRDISALPTSGFRAPRTDLIRGGFMPGGAVRITDRTGADRDVTPKTAYHLATDDDTNPWVRTEPAESAAGRVLLVQFSSDLLQSQNPGGVDAGSAYYDKLYSGTRKGYDRMDDFWEIPQWMGFASKLFPNADVYVVRNMDEAKSFLRNAGYDRVAFSSLDVNASFIKDLVSGYEGIVDIGGYADPKVTKGLPNATWHPSMEAWAKAAGVPYVNGVDYRHFKGSAVIPRLTMSQGCKHKCAFCTVEKNIVETPATTVEQQIDAIAELGASLVYLNDKTFGQAANHKTLPALAARMREKNPGFRGFVVQTTASQMVRFDPAWLKESGIKFVELGIETYNDPILKELHKPATEAVMDKAVAALRKAGIALIPNIIIGFPQETADTYGRTLKWLKDNSDVISHANIYNLALYEDAELGKKMQSLADGDFNENVLEKSFHKDPEIHRTFAGDLYGLASTLLDPREASVHFMPRPGKAPEGLARVPHLSEASELWSTGGGSESAGGSFMPAPKAVKLPGDGAPVPTWASRAMQVLNPDPADAEPRLRRVARTQAGRAVEQTGLTWTLNESSAGQITLGLTDQNGIARGGLIISTDEDAGTGYVESSWVDMPLRGRGMGEALYREGATRLQELGIDSLEGDVVGIGAMGLRGKLFGQPEAIERTTKRVYRNEDNRGRSLEDIPQPKTIDEALAQMRQFPAEDVSGTGSAAYYSDLTMNVRSRVDPNVRFMPGGAKFLPESKVSPVPVESLGRGGSGGSVWLAPDGTLYDAKGRHGNWAKANIEQAADTDEEGALDVMRGLGWNRVVDGPRGIYTSGPLNKAQKAVLKARAAARKLPVMDDNTDKVSVEGTENFLPKDYYFMPRPKSRVDAALAKGAKGKTFPAEVYDMVSVRELAKHVDSDPSVEEWLSKVATIVGEIPGLRLRRAGADWRETLDHAVRALADNIEFVFRQADPAKQAEWRTWYEQAHDMTNEWGAEFGVEPDAVAAINARLSAQKDWFENVTMTRRLLEITRDNPRWTTAHRDFTEVVVRKGSDEEGVSADRKAANLKALAEVPIGARLSELTPAQAAWMIRAHNELFGDTGIYDHKLQPATSQDAGTKLRWQGYGPLTRAVRIYRDQSAASIYREVGNAHKVRNFYNNHVDPSNRTDLTADTHAVGVAILDSVSSEHPVVKATLSGPRHAASGYVGIYSVIADAYRLAAERIGSGYLPREVQSVTWETIRRRLGSAAKGSAAAKAWLPGTIQNVHEAVDAGTLDAERGRELIWEALGIAEANRGVPRNLSDELLVYLPDREPAQTKLKL